MGVAQPNLALEAEVDADLDTLATALYVTTDDFLADNPQHRPWRPKIGLQPRLSDAELITLMVLQALLGFTSEARWLRHARTHFGSLFPYLPTQSAYNKRVRESTGMLRAVIAHLTAHTRVVSDDVWVVDSTPVECGRSRETAKRSDLAGWAEYGYCASHSRYFCGLRLHLLCTLQGLPVGWALTGAKADEGAGLADIVANTPALAHLQHTGLTWIADKNYFGATFEADVAATGIDLLRPARKGECPRPGEQFFKPLRQIIESVNDTLKGQLDLEAHGGRTIAGVCTRVAQRVLAMTAAIWHNDRIGASIHRSLI